MMRNSVLSLAFMVALLGAFCSGCARLRALEEPTRVRIMVFDASWPVAQQQATAKAYQSDIIVRYTAEGIPRFELLSETLRRHLDQEATVFGKTFEFGPVHAALIEQPDAMPVQSQGWLSLVDSLSRTEAPFKIAFMPQPVFQAGPIVVQHDRLDLAELLAREDVAMALAPRGSFYLRTARIGNARNEATQYIILGNGASGGETGVMPEWAAMASKEKVFCLLDGTSRMMRLRVYNAHGRLVDILDVAPRESALMQGRFFNFSELLADESENAPQAGEDEAANE